MVKNKTLLLFISCCLNIILYKAQDSNIKELIIRTDTSIFYFSKNILSFQGDRYFWFTPSSNGTVDISYVPQKQTNVLLFTGKDIVLIDSAKKQSDGTFKAKIQFRNFVTTKSYTLSVISILANSEQIKESVTLMSIIPVNISIDKNRVTELFLGEEKTIELDATNALNISLTNTWIKTPDYDYLLSVDDDNLKIMIKPYSTGTKELSFKLKTIKPVLMADNYFSYELPPITIKLLVKPTRLNFLNIDKTDFYFDDKSAANEYVQIDYNKNLELNKLYRIEDQLEQGGKLIAELFTRSMIGDNKILCSLHPYSLHKTSDGYLYIKNSDQSKFVTNFNILLKPVIEKISILREGEDWSDNLSVFPNEKIELKIEGKGLSKAKLLFDGCKNIKQDSTKIFDDIIFYEVEIPLSIDKKRLNIFLNKKLTRFELLVREYQKPKDFDFISIDYGSGNVGLKSSVFNTPVLDRKTIKDVNIFFNQELIDTDKKLFGKQYLFIEIKLFNEDNDLIEYQKIENVVICPGESSPRYLFYNPNDCSRSAFVNVNDYLLHKTYDMDGWNKLEIVFKHQENKYQQTGFSRKIILIKQQLRSFDLQVSFPTGLLTKDFSQPGIGQFTGVSAAFLAQFSFYDHEKISKLKPYNIGAGFIALNALNLNGNTKTDIGVLVMASVVPLKVKKKFNFPLYAGFGYLLKSSSWFAVFGPGVQFNF